MGSRDGDADESPASVVEIPRAFWIGAHEITNRQFDRFRSSHDSGYISQFNKDHVARGLPANQPDQPVLRVSWDDAMAFSGWLAKQSGETITLPDEAQWEYAARAGTATPLPWGSVDMDFSPHANLADAKLNDLTIRDSPDWIPAAAFNDRSTVTSAVGRYLPNAWGIHDMHGNAAEWTRSIYQSYPWQAGDGRNDIKAGGERVLRGGSYYDRPHRARSAFRLAYPPWQRVHNAGFRIVMEIPDPPVAAAAGK
jgi:formylglycine-generating enzyme required for sulfatase activity